MFPKITGIPSLTVIFKTLALFKHCALWPDSFALEVAVASKDARIAIIAMTTNNSINVKPFTFLIHPLSCAACFSFPWIPHGRKKRVWWIVEFLLLYGSNSKSVYMRFHYFHIFFNKFQTHILFGIIW